MHVDEHTISLDDSPVYYRIAEAATGAPPLYLHGIPTSSDDWTEFLARTGGLAPDLIGFGRSGKGEHLDFSLDGLTDFVEDFLAHLDVGEVQIVGHDWGAAVALKFAHRHPERVRRLVLCNAPALVEGFAWPRFVRWWQIRGVGEMLMGATTRTVLTRALRQGCVQPAAWPKARIDAVWDQFDQGTQRAILRLYRDADERRLAEAGAGLGALDVPALVLWGQRDPWLAPELGRSYATRLGSATLEPIDEAGHWPWLDDPAVVDRVADFLGGT